MGILNSFLSILYLKQWTVKKNKVTSVKFKNKAGYMFHIIQPKRVFEPLRQSASSYIKSLPQECVWVLMSSWMCSGLDRFLQCCFSSGNGRNEGFYTPTAKADWAKNDDGWETDEREKWVKCHEGWSWAGKHPCGNIESMSGWKRKSGKGELVEFPGFPSSSVVFSVHSLPLYLHSTPSVSCAAQLSNSTLQDSTLLSAELVYLTLNNTTIEDCV